MAPVSWSVEIIDDESDLKGTMNTLTTSTTTNDGHDGHGHDDDALLCMLPLPLRLLTAATSLQSLRRRSPLFLLQKVGRLTHPTRRCALLVRHCKDRGAE